MTYWLNIGKVVNEKGLGDGRGHRLLSVRSIVEFILSTSPA